MWGASFDNGERVKEGGRDRQRSFGFLDMDGWYEEEEKPNMDNMS